MYVCIVLSIYYTYVICHCIYIYTLKSSPDRVHQSATQEGPDCIFPRPLQTGKLALYLQCRLSLNVLHSHKNK